MSDARRGQAETTGESEPLDLDHGQTPESVPTVDLFDELVETGVAPQTAYDSIQEHLMLAGYPPDYPWLARPDAAAIRSSLELP